MTVSVALIWFANSQIVSKEVRPSFLPYKICVGAVQQIGCSLA